MKLTLNVIKKWDIKYLKNYIKFSKLMETSKRSHKRVFLETHAVLESQNGEFVIIKNKSYEIVGYCLLNYGIVGSKYKRIVYFTVPVHCRNQSYGKVGMKTIIKKLIDSNEGCTLACEAGLNNFYKQSGLVFIKFDYENKTEHIMGLDCNKNRDDLHLQPTIEESLIENIYKKFDDYYNLSILCDD